jgi:putative transposase
MPRKACRPMDERLKFVARLLDGEQMAGLCREFGISRKTGYKILTRYNATGLEGLTDRSRRPYRHANQLACQALDLVGLDVEERDMDFCCAKRRTIAAPIPDAPPVTRTTLPARSE